MYCKNCGNEIQGTEKFCPKCGNKVESVMGIQSHPRKKKSVKKIVILVCLLIILAGSIAGAGIYYYVQNDYSYLAVVRNEEGKYGYINEKGREIIECQYDMAYDFGENGLAAVGEKTGLADRFGYDLYKWGFINQKGNIVIPFEYDDFCRDGFQEDGLLAVAKQIDTDVEGNPVLRWGFINDKGEMITTYKYVDYDDGYWKYHSGWSKTGLHVVAMKVGIDEKGEDILDYGVINRNGEEIVPMGEYNHIELSNTSLIWAQKLIDVYEGEEIYKWGAIDEEGNEMIPFQYENVGYWNLVDVGGLFPVQKMIGYNEEGEKIYKYGYINEKGAEIIPFQFRSAAPFYNGLAEVSNEDWDYGFINENGEIVIPYQEAYNCAIYSSIGSLDDTGLIQIISKNRYGLINQNGDEIIPCKYWGIERITDDLYGAYDWEHGELHCYNKNGMLCFQIETRRISYGENGWFMVGYDNGELDKDTKMYKCQYMDEEGNIVLQLSEEYIDAEGFIKIK